MEQRKLTEKEVLDKMADNVMNQSTREKLERLERLRTPKADGEGAPEDVQGGSTGITSEFSGKDEGEAKEVKKGFTSMDGAEINENTPGIDPGSFKRMPDTPDNALPATNDTAQLPMAVFTATRMLGKHPIVTNYGIFRRNEDGVEKLIVNDKRTVADPLKMREADARIAEAESAIKEMIRQQEDVVAAKLRAFMSEKSIRLFQVTDHDNVPVVKYSTTKSEHGAISSRFRVVESGYGSVLAQYVIVPKRANRAFDDQDMETASNKTVVAELINDNNIEYELVSVDRANFPVFLGSKFSGSGLAVAECTQHAASSNAILSNDPSVGVEERIIMRSKAMPVLSNKSAVEVAEFQSKQKAKLENLAEKFKGAVNANFVMYFRIKNTARKVMASPANSMPRRTTSVIPVGAKFVPGEGNSPTENTDLYLASLVRNRRGNTATLSMEALLGTIQTPDDKNKFVFVPEVTSTGIGRNPVFYQTGETLSLEPYHTTLQMVNGTYKGIKPVGQVCEFMAKKVKDPKTGMIKNETNLIGTEGYDTKIYEELRGRCMATCAKYGITFPTIEQIASDVITTPKSKAKKEVKQKFSLDTSLDPSDLASIMAQDMSSIMAYNQALANRAETKKNNRITDYSGNIRRIMVKAAEVK